MSQETSPIILLGKPGDTVLVKSREMIGWTQTLPWWQGRERGKDDRKQNTWAPLPAIEEILFLSLNRRIFRKIV